MQANRSPLKCSKANAKSTSTDYPGAKQVQLVLSNRSLVPHRRQIAVFCTRHCDSDINPPSCAGPHDTTISTAVQKLFIAIIACEYTPLLHCMVFFFPSPQGALLRRRNKSYAVIFFWVRRSSIGGSLPPAKHSECLTLSS